MNAIDLVNLLFLTLWCGIVALAVHGAAVHRRVRRQYLADAEDPRCTPENRATFRGWARDEWFRMTLKALLAVCALGWLLFWMAFADELELVFHDWTLALALRTMTVVGVGGSVLLLSAWTREVARHRRDKYPDITPRTG